MSIKINNKEYLSYEEQVLKNKKDIEKLEKKKLPYYLLGDMKVNKIIVDMSEGVRLKKLLMIGNDNRKYKCRLVNMSGIDIDMQVMIHDDNKRLFTLEYGESITIYYDNGSWDDGKDSYLDIWGKDGSYERIQGAYAISATSGSILATNIELG